MASKIYIGDVGTIIRVDAGQDISTATTLDIKYRKPDGTEATWTGVLDGTNFVRYTTIAGDLDQTGGWQIQLVIALPGWSGCGETTGFTVYEKWE